MKSFDARFLLVFVALSLGLPAHAQSFGKVFSTPQERVFLDKQREEALRELDEEERFAVLTEPSSAQAELAAVVPQLVHMSGVVRKTDGNHTVWLNDVPISVQDLPANVSLEFQRGMGVLRIKGASGEYLVRPGQTLNAQNGVVREDYELTFDEAFAIRAELASRNGSALDANPLSVKSENTDSQREAPSEEQIAQAEESISDISNMLRLMLNENSEGGSQ